MKIKLREKDGRWHWEIVSSNGYIRCRCRKEGYVNKHVAKYAALDFCQDVHLHIWRKFSLPIEVIE